MKSGKLRLLTFPLRTIRPNRAYGRSRDLPVPAHKERPSRLIYFGPDSGCKELPKMNADQKVVDLLSNPRKAGRPYRPREFFLISIFVANLIELDPYPPRLR